MGYDGQFYRVLAHDPLLLHVDPLLSMPAALAAHSDARTGVPGR
ncbi:MAG: hypothetical protein R2724_27455 [Bryobacterales bacterium]